MRRSASWLMVSMLALFACSGQADAPAEESSEPMEAMSEMPGCGYPADAAERPSPPDSVEIPLGEATAKLCYGRPSAKGRVMVGGQDPFDRLYPLVHRHQTPVRAVIPDVIRVEASSVILDCNGDRIFVTRDLENDPVRFRVSHGIRDRFLGDAE